jgi:Beta-propeller repeat
MSQFSTSVAVGRVRVVRGPGWSLSAGLLIALALAAVAAFAASPATAPDAEQRAQDAYGKLPLSFVANAGQTDRRVRYYTQDAGFSFYFTDSKAVLAFEKGKRGQALELRFLGANPNAELVAAARRPGRVNYLAGSQHHTNLPTYGRLVYRDLWPGIDMSFRGAGGKLKYEFYLHAGADPDDIRLAYAGAERLSLGAAGSLLIDTPLGALRDAPPTSYQRIGGSRVAVESRYVLAGNHYGFALGRYDRTQPLVIDPSLVYSTYLGGSSLEFGRDNAVDGAGSAYVTGMTDSADFPTTPGAFDASDNPNSDAFVTKLNPGGSTLVYSTYLGGSGQDFGQGIEVDSTGSAYVVGRANAADFPTTPGAFDTVYNGGFFGDAFVAKLSPSGSALLYSTYLGGGGNDQTDAIALDAAGSAYVSGYTDSTDFPTTPGAFDTTLGPAGFTDAFATKLSPGGSSLVYSTYLGGGDPDFGSGIAVDGAGSAYVTGVSDSTDFPTTAGAFDTTHNGDADAFVTKLSASGSAPLVYSTYLGGSDVDAGGAIAVEAGSAYVAGTTESTNFPTTPGAFDTGFNGTSDAFVARLSASGSAPLVYSTYLGGLGLDNGVGIAVGAAGSTYVIGRANSADFPTTPDAFDTTHNGLGDAYVTKLSGSGSAPLQYSTYLGGDRADFAEGIALDSAGGAYVTGTTRSTAFPTTPGAFDTTPSVSDEAFVTKLSFEQPPPCEAKLTISQRGSITAGNGDRASFKGSAQLDGLGGVQGEERYRDRGPVQPIQVRSLELLGATCSADRTRATIFGRASIDRQGSHSLQIDVQDLGEPGTGRDTYRILLDSGYDSGERVLESGNVDIVEG